MGTGVGRSDHTVGYGTYRGNKALDSKVLTRTFCPIMCLFPQASCWDRRRLGLCQRPEEDGHLHVLHSHWPDM